MNTQVYVITKGRKSETVRATSMLSIDKYCQENGYSKWRLVGMMSTSEIILSQSFRVVA